MAEATIPVDLTNPGQVFACLGLMEIAEASLGGAVGGFDWTAAPIFRLCADGERNPVEAALAMLAQARVASVAPDGSALDTAKAGVETVAAGPDEGYPCPAPDGAPAMPALLLSRNCTLRLDHWADGTRREPFKTFAGQQVGARIAANLLEGDPKKPASSGAKDLIAKYGATLAADPFGPVCATGGTFNFDARGAWDSLRIGTSLDEQGELTGLSPLVDLLAAVGLQHARPEALDTYTTRYAAWATPLPVSLARLALSAPEFLHDPRLWRRFRAGMGSDKYYKKFQFAEEETPS